MFEDLIIWLAINHKFSPLNEIKLGIWKIWID